MAGLVLFNILIKWLQQVILVLLMMFFIYLIMSDNDKTLSINPYTYTFLLISERMANWKTEK